MLPPLLRYAYVLLPAFVTPLRQAEGRADLARASREAIVAIQACLTGATPGQVSLTGGDTGQLSVADSTDGRVSFETDEA